MTWISLQGRDNDRFKHFERIQAFTKKLEHWRLRVGQGRMNMFTHLSENLLADESDTDVKQMNIQSVVVNHLKLLHRKFLQYFPTSPTEKFEWVRNPFQADMSTISLSAQMNAQLIELYCNRTLKVIFGKLKLSDCWLHVAKEYSQLADEAISVLLPFSTT